MTMANNGWDREIINPLEKPLGSDINIAQAQGDRALRETFMRLFMGRVGSGSSDLSGNPPSGFVGDGFKVRQNSPLGLSVKVTLGLGFQWLPGDVPSSVGGVSGLDDLSPYKPLPLLADAVINGISGGPGAGNTRIDIVEVRMNRVVGNATSRRVLNPLTGVFEPNVINKTLAFTLDGSTGVVTAPALSTAAIGYKMGIAGVTPAEPAVTPGYVKIASIKISTALAQVTKSEIIDSRLLLAPYGMESFAADFSVPIGVASPPTGVTFRGAPGVEMVVTKLTTANNNRFRVWLIGGGAPLGGTMNGSIIQPSAAGAFYPLLCAGNFTGVLSSGNVADLANVNISSPAQTFAEGTPFFATEFWVAHQAGGTTDTTIPTPIIALLQGTIQRY